MKESTAHHHKDQHCTQGENNLPLLMEHISTAHHPLQLRMHGRCAAPAPAPCPEHAVWLVKRAAQHEHKAGGDRAHIQARIAALKVEIRIG